MVTIFLCVNAEGAGARPRFDPIYEFLNRAAAAADWGLPQEGPVAGAWHPLAPLSHETCPMHDGSARCPDLLWSLPGAGPAARCWCSLLQSTNTYYSPRNCPRGLPELCVSAVS